MRYGYVAFLIAAFAATQSKADVSDCKFMFEQGIFNRIELFRSSDNRRITVDEYCDTSSKSTSAGLGIKWGGVELSGSQASAATSAICRKSSSDTDLRDRAQQLASSVDANLLQAVETCIKAAANGLNVRIDQRNDVLHLTIVYSRGPMSSPTVKLSNIQVYGLECSGPLYDRLREKPIELDATEAVILHCSRKDRTERFSGDGVPQILAGGHVSVDTSAGPIIAEIPRRLAQNSNAFEERVLRLERALKDSERVEIIGPFEFPKTRGRQAIPLAKDAKFCALTKVELPSDSSGRGACRVVRDNGVWMMENLGTSPTYSNCEVACWK